MGTDKTAYQSGKGGNRGKKESKPGFRQTQASFIDYELSKEQQASCKAWQVSAEEAWQAVMDLNESGYKITFRDDDRNSASACWIIPGDDHPQNTGLILAGRGSTPFKALKQALFKHYKLFEERWGDYTRAASRDEIDD